VDIFALIRARVRAKATLKSCSFERAWQARPDTIVASLASLTHRPPACDKPAVFIYPDGLHTRCGRAPVQSLELA